MGPGKRLAVGIACNTLILVIAIGIEKMNWWSSGYPWFIAGFLILCVTAWSIRKEMSAVFSVGKLGKIIEILKSQPEQPEISHAYRRKDPFGLWGTVKLLLQLGVGLPAFMITGISLMVGTVFFFAWVLDFFVPGAFEAFSSGFWGEFFPPPSDE